MKRNLSHVNSGTGNPRVAAVIISWNCLDDITECIESLLAMDYSNCEIVIVDNASTDGSAGKIEKLFPEVILLRNDENLGCGVGNNTGMKYAVENDFQYAFLLNADIVLERDTLSKLVASAEENPRAELLSPVLYYYNTRSKIQHCGSRINWDEFTTTHLVNLADAKNIPCEEFWLFGTALLINCKVMKTIGYYQEKYFVYCEDIDFSVRAERAGFKHKLVPSASAYHKSHDLDVGKKMPPYYFFYMTRNKFWFWRDNVMGIKKIKFLRKYLANMISEIGRYKRNPDKEITDAYCDGLYCAFRNIIGKWDQTIKMPRKLKMIILWRPYFWVELLRFNFKGIIHGIYKRLQK